MKIERSASSEAPGLEATLLDHRDSGRLAIIVDDTAGERQCFAYVLSRNMSEPDADELRDYAAAIPVGIPAPSRFVMLRSLLQLPADSAGARGEVVDIVAAICAKVLRLKNINAEANFMDLGGQSLAALKVVERIREVLDVEIPLRALFECPAIMDVAQVVLDSEPRPGRTAFITSTLLRMLTVSEAAPPLQSR
jgi:acyl carrier protein